MNKTHRDRLTQLVTALFLLTCLARAAESPPAPPKPLPFMPPPADFANDFGTLRSPLLFDDGKPVRTAEDWPKRRGEILRYWQGQLAAWPALLERPQIERL